MIHSYSQSAFPRVLSRRCHCRKMKIIHAVLVFSVVARCIDGSRLEVVSSRDSDDRMQNFSATSIEENEEKRNIYVDEACPEFDEETPIGSGWLRSDCVTVWSQWADTLDGFQYQSYSYRGVFNETARDMRQQGNPCLVDSFRYPDGVGSSAVRLLATWMFAEEMNCDWITPESPRSTIDENGTSLYCHPLMSVVGHAPDSLDQAYDLENGSWRCEVTNWLRFFRYDAHGTDWQKSGTVKTIHVRCDCISCYEHAGMLKVSNLLDGRCIQNICIKCMHTETLLLRFLKVYTPYVCPLDLGGFMPENTADTRYPRVIVGAITPIKCLYIIRSVTGLCLSSSRRKVYRGRRTCLARNAIKGLKAST